MADMKLEVCCSFLQQARYLWFRDDGPFIRQILQVRWVLSILLSTIEYFRHHGTTLIFLFMPSKKEGKRENEGRTSCSPSLTQSLAPGHTLQQVGKESTHCSNMSQLHPKLPGCRGFFYSKKAGGTGPWEHLAVSTLTQQRKTFLEQLFHLGKHTKKNVKKLVI